MSFTKTQKRLLDLLANVDTPLNRKEICYCLGLAWTTTYDNLLKLQEKNIIIRFPVHCKNRGRPQIFWTLSAEHYPLNIELIEEALIQ